MMTAPPLFSVEPVLCVHALMHMHDQCRHGPARPGRTGSSVDQWQHGANVQSLLTTYSVYFCSAGSAAHCAGGGFALWAERDSVVPVAHGLFRHRTSPNKSRAG